MQISLSSEGISGVISRGKARERRPHCNKAAKTHRNGVPVVEKTHTNSKETKKLMLITMEFYSQSLNHMHCSEYKNINHQLLSTWHISLLLTDLNC